MMISGTYAVCAVIIIGSAVLAVAGLLLARKIMDAEHLKSTHEVGGYLLSVVGTLYAVLLGLVVVDAMAKFQVARDTTSHEANALMDVYMLSDCLPKDKKDASRALCFDYATEVQNNEWKAMSKGQISTDARRIVIKLSKLLVSFEPVTENQKALYPQLVQESTELWDNRRMRVNMALYGVPAVEWIALIAGGAVTVIFTYFFGLEHLRLQICMTAMVAILISLNLVLLLMFGYPFSGSISISPDSFRLVQDVFEGKLGMVPATPVND
jgi:hypothetical protein